MSEKLAGTGASQGGLCLLNTLERAFSPRNIKEQGLWVAISFSHEENIHGVKAVTWRLKIGILVLGNVTWPSRTSTVQDISVT